MARAVVIRWSTDTAEGTVSGSLARPSGNDSGIGVVLAHGAGAGYEHPFMCAVRDGLAAAGHPTLTFNYPYIEEGRRAPDRPVKLLAAHRAATDKLASRVSRVVLAGKSMGGRMASHLAAGIAPDGTDLEPVTCAGLVYLGYPLVAVGKSEPRDVSHLHRIEAPMLFVAGTRDRLGPIDLVRRVIDSIAGAELHVVASGDHSFGVPKASGRTNAEAMSEVIAAAADWVTARRWLSRSNRLPTSGCRRSR